MVQNKVLRKISEPTRRNLRASRETQHDEKIHDLHLSSNIIRAIKPKSKRRGRGHMARMENKRNAQRFGGDI
jgi:hypothetical protein